MESEIACNVLIWSRSYFVLRWVWATAEFPPEADRRETSDDRYGVGTPI